MEDPALLLAGLSPVSGKPIQARFDGGMLSSDAGILVLREVEQRLGVAERLAGCIDDPRAQEHVVHSLPDMVRFRLMMIAAGYEDGKGTEIRVFLRRLLRAIRASWPTTKILIRADTMLARGRFCSLKAWGLKIRQHRGYKRAKVAVARKLAVVMHAMWVNGTEFRWGAAEAA